MNPDGIWQVFIETGSPEVYLIYNRVRNTEENNVFNDPRSGATGHGL